MRYNTLSAFEDLRISGLRIQKTIYEYLQLPKTHPQPIFWPKEGLTVKSWISEDLFLDIRARSKLDGVDSPPEKHALFSQHAIPCGLILFNLNIRIQVVGQQLVTQCWPRASHSLPILPAIPGVRESISLTAIIAAYSILPLQSRTCFSRSTLVVLKKTKLESSSKEFQSVNPELIIAPRWSHAQIIDTLQLVAFLKSKLFEEEPILMYNYFGMHKRSVELLRLIRGKEHQKFPQYFTSMYMPDESFISNIVKKKNTRRNGYP
ncbi:hypothetical protein N7451_012198 [Penicillium sp. IBT 35674x]|nr:hypothetical protein N7451_012198 [Penicillium sp. IBT 35674x]